MGTSLELRDRRWRALCRRLKWTLPPVCWVCSNDIDRSLSGREKWGWTLDHVVPRHKAPHLTYVESNLRPAHNWCNSTRGGQVAQDVNFSRNWGGNAGNG